MKLKSATLLAIIGMLIIISLQTVNIFLNFDLIKLDQEQISMYNKIFSISYWIGQFLLIFFFIFLFINQQKK